MWKLLKRSSASLMTSDFPPFLCGFTKDHNSEYFLLEMMKACRINNSINGIEMTQKILIYYGLNYRLLFFYEFSKNNAKLYNRFQRTKEVPQSSILGPLLLNIFCYDIFLFKTNENLYNYANGNTLYVIIKNLFMVKSNPEANFTGLERWFHERFLILENVIICWWATMTRMIKWI